MSLVTIMATDKFITLMSDGRVISDSNEITDENYQKFLSLSNGKKFIAYAGTKDICEIFVSTIRTMVEEGHSFTDINFVLSESMKTIAIPEGRIALISYGGLNDDNELVFYTVDSLNPDDISLFKPTEKKYSYAILSNSEQKDDYSKKFVEYMKEIGINSPSDAIQAQKLLNSYVAENDISVNNVTYRMVIKTT